MHPVFLHLFLLFDFIYLIEISFEDPSEAIKENEKVYPFISISIADDNKRDVRQSM